MAHLSLRGVAAPAFPRRPWPTAAAAALIALVVGACGDEPAAPVYNCCATGVYYVCPTRLTSGQCNSIPSDPTGCVLQTNPCPPGTGP
jgi:hypothetical protein